MDKRFHTIPSNQAPMAEELMVDRMGFAAEIPHGKSMVFNPKVSIVIPVYNGANYLSEAIDSALAQTYKNVEVIVVNDGSNDSGETEKVARAYGNRIRYLFKNKGGVASALNSGIEEMEGEYFSWLSHDDVYYSHKIERQIDFLRNLRDRKVVLYADYECIDDKSRHLAFVRANHKELSRKPLYSVLRGNINGCSVLVPKDILCAMGRFDGSFKTTQDYHLWFRIVRNYKVHHMPVVLVKYRIHAAQGTARIPEHLDEGNNLWISLMNSLSDNEKLSCEKTLFHFYLKMARHLTKSPFARARKYAMQMARQRLGDKPINIFAYLTAKVYFLMPIIRASRMLRIFRRFRRTLRFEV
jgi:glycosyltransferase involved in cell wall biosynthesis